MRKATITALKKSIATWKRRAEGEHIMPNVGNCALCARFNMSGVACKFRGEKCPVYEVTGKNYCQGSSAYNKYALYYHIAWSFDNAREIKYAASVMGKRRAQKEVDFLKSLLPDA